MRIIFFMSVLVCTGAAFAFDAIVTTHGNNVQWDDSGQIKAVIYETEAIGGIAGNYWPDLNNPKIKKVGQTFKCQGPILATVQLGLDNLDTGYKGLQLRKKPFPDFMIRLFKGGVDGKLVMEKMVKSRDLTSDMRLDVDLPSDNDTLWYIEYEPLSTPKGRMFINAQQGDAYSGGQAYLNRKPANQVDTTRLKPSESPDLLLRVTRKRIAEAKRDGKVILWAARPEKRIWMNPEKTINLMLEDSPDKPVKLAGARNERVSFQLTLTPRGDFRIKEATLRVPAFQSPAGGQIEPVRIEWLRHALEYRRGNTSGRLYPDALAATNKAVTLPGQPDFAMNQTFWVSLRIPDNVKPGTYKTVATARVNNDIVLKKNIELNVYPLTLPKQTHTRTVLYRGGGVTPDVHKWWLKDLADFRISMDSPSSRNNLGVLRQNNFSEDAYKTIFSKEYLNEFVEGGKLENSLGLPVNNVTPWGDLYRVLRAKDDATRQAGIKGIKRFWKIYYPILKENGWVDQAHCRMPDELGAKQINNMKDMAALFRKCAPGVKIMVTAIGTPKEDQLKLAVGIADIWTPSSRYYPVALDFYKSRQAKGELVCPYIHDFTWDQWDPAACRMYFWGLRENGADGSCYFAIKRSDCSGNWFGVTRRTDTWPGDGSIYCDPGWPNITADDKGIWRTVRLYRIGDGLEDMEYFWLLDQAVAKAKKNGLYTPQRRKQYNDIIRRANAMSSYFLSFSNDMDELESIRSDIVNLINKLEE